MTLPGFTAEASLSRTAERYRLRGTSNPGATRERVVPQACACGWVSGWGWVCYCAPGPHGGPPLQ
jgi:hypothetical protein